MSVEVTVVRTIETMVTETYTVDSLPEGWDTLNPDDRFDALMEHLETVSRWQRHDGDEEVQGTVQVYRIDAEMR